MKGERLIYKEVEPRKKLDDGNPLLLLLHGRGTDENDLLGLSPYLDERLHIVSVRAPFQFQWGPGYAWYDIEEVGKPDNEKFPRSRDMITNLIDTLHTGTGSDNSRTYLLGFSMGSVMAYAVALASPEKVTGVIAHSGYIAEGNNTNYRWDDAQRVAFFIAHGIADPVIPVQFGRRADELMKQHGLNYQYKEYSFAHQISEESLNDLSTWLSEKIGI
jgi:phospholipase/carboxylesterase